MNVAFRRTRAHLAPGLALAQQFTGQGAIETAALGAEVMLSDGRVLVDFGSYAVTLAGHRPEPVVRAVERQLACLPTSTKSLANDIAPAFAERLVQFVNHPRLQRVWLGNNGSDVVEAALKLARLSTGRLRVLAVDGAYHGKSLGALAATASPRYRAGLEPLLTNVTHLPIDADAAEREMRVGDIAALIVEPVQGEGGVRPLPVSVLRVWREACRRHGVFFISDEVQMGLYRCGAAVLSIEWGLDPDAVLFGKVLGGGVLPLSAVVCSEEMFAPLLEDPFVHSLAFAGHPLSCAGGLAALEELQRLATRGSDLSVALERGFHGLVQEFPDVVRGARGRGLAWGMECRSVAASGHVLAELAPAGLIVSPCLGRPEVLRFLPPLVTSPEQVKVAFAAIQRGCVEAREAVPQPPVPASEIERHVDTGGCVWIYPLEELPDHVD